MQYYAQKLFSDTNIFLKFTVQIYIKQIFHTKILCLLYIDKTISQHYII